MSATSEPVSLPLSAGDLSDDDFKFSAEIERRRQAFLLALANDNSPVQPPLTDANGMLLDEPEHELRPRSASRPALAGPRRERRAQTALLP